MSRKQQQARREEIKRILGFLNDDNHWNFKRMYSPNDLNKDINQVVDDMPARQLQWALHQCNASYHRIFQLLKS
jgi:ssDNA-specific exonuclease RecJ